MNARRLLAILIAAGGLAGCSGVDEAAAWFPDQQYRPEIQPLGWSADGERVLFVHSELIGGYDHADFRCGGSGLYETDGRSPPRPVLTGEPWCRGAAGWLLRFSLSADAGTVFVFPDFGTGDCATVPALDVARRAWREAVRVCGTYVHGAAISPDGGRLAASLGCGQRLGGDPALRVQPRGCVDGDGERLTVMNTDGSRRRVLGAPGDRYPVWSPDGRSLAVVQEPGGRRGNDWTIAVVDVESGRRRVVTRGERPAWSPDGEWLAFTRFPDGAPVTLHVIRTDGTGERTVFEQDREEMRRGPQYPSPPGWPNDPVWSPDGRRIAFTRHSQRGNTLWVVNAGGTGLRRLAERIEPAP